MINFGNEWVLRLELLITTHKIQLHWTLLITTHKIQFHWTTNFKAKTKDLFKLLSLNPLLRNYFGDLKIIRNVAQNNKFMTHFVRAIIWKLSYIQTILEPNFLPKKKNIRTKQIIFDTTTAKNLKARQIWAAAPPPWKNTGRSSNQTRRH